MMTTYHSPFSMFASPSLPQTVYYTKPRPPPISRLYRKSEPYVSYQLNTNPSIATMAWYGNGQGMAMHGGGGYGAMPGSAPPGSSYYSFPSSGGMTPGAATGYAHHQHNYPALANGYTSGQAYSQLGYDYRLPSLNWSPDSSWSGYEWANAQFRYGGPGAGGRTGVRGSQFGVMDRNWYDGIVSITGVSMVILAEVVIIRSIRFHPFSTPAACDNRKRFKLIVGFITTTRLASTG